MMKRLVVTILSLMVLFTLSACAMNGAKYHEGDKVKCPACGYEFNVPSDA